jgi:V/A-type H+-transporting ATPase subunit C
MAKKVSPLNYAFAVGKIRAMEKYLIRQEVFEETIELDLNGALRLFTESSLYSADLVHVKGSQHLETILNRELANLKKLIRDLIFDKELLCLIEIDNLKDVCLACRSFHSDFLSDYIMHLIDMHNIKSFLRLYVLKEPLEKLDAILICEGFIKKKNLLGLYSLDLTAFLNHLEYVNKHYRTIDYTYNLREGVQKLAQENSFAALEKAIDDFLIQILRPAKYLVFGPEPILAYYFAKVNEINLIRMIILAKLNNVPGDLVKERLNAVYA